MGSYILYRTLSSSAHANKCVKVCLRLRANLGANTSLSFPNWCLDCLTIESITYKPGILYSGLHYKNIIDSYLME